MPAVLKIAFLAGALVFVGRASEAVLPQTGAEVPKEIRDAIRTRNYPDAERRIIDAIHASPSSASGLLPLLGGIFFLDGKYLNCASALEKAKAARLLDESSRFTLALAYVKLGRLDWARGELGVLAAGNPANASYPYWLAKMDFAQQHYEAAIPKFRAAIRLDPSSVRAYDSLGLCYQAMGKTDEAIRNFRVAIDQNRKANPASPWPALNLGALLVKLGRFVEAEPYLEESLRLGPHLAPAHYRLGIVEEKLGRNKRAIAEFQAAASGDGSYADPWYALARVYRASGNTQAAEAAAQNFEKLRH